MSRAGARNNLARAQRWKSHRIAPESYLAEFDEGSRGAAPLPRRHLECHWRRAQMVSSPLWNAKSLGHSRSPRTRLPHGDVDADSRRLAGETCRVADSANGTNCSAREAEFGGQFQLATRCPRHR